MPMEVAYSVVLVTAPDAGQAEKLSGELVKRRLAGCVTRIPGAASEYWWEGKVEKAEEVLLIIKTRTNLIPDVVQCVKENHSHSVPEAIAFPIVEGNKAYLDWLGANTLFTRPVERRRVAGPQDP